jgi:hypothetical protein
MSVWAKTARSSGPLPPPSRPDSAASALAAASAASSSSLRRRKGSQRAPRNSVGSAKGVGGGEDGSAGLGELGRRAGDSGQAQSLLPVSSCVTACPTPRKRTTHRKSAANRPNPPSNAWMSGFAAARGVSACTLPPRDTCGWVAAAVRLEGTQT